MLQIHSDSDKALLRKRRNFTTIDFIEYKKLRSTLHSRLWRLVSFSFSFRLQFAQEKLWSLSCSFHLNWSTRTAHELLKQFAFQNNSIETQNPSRKRSSRYLRSNVITLVCTTTDVVLMQPIKASSQFINTSKELMTTRTSDRSDQKGFSFLIR